jgi:7-cyano-7-deazaguanine reductase
MDKHDLPLGREVDYDNGYAPELLRPIPRSLGRAELGLTDALPFTGWDIWNGYELSWLDPRGKPKVAWGEFRVPAESPALVESKSLKLYLNGFNQLRIESEAELSQRIAADLSACAGAPVEVELHLPSAWGAAPLVQPTGLCLDDIDIDISHYQPAPELLQVTAGDEAEQRYFSRLLRSRCPVTGQPDWGGVTIELLGPQIDAASLLAYIVSFRQHQGFHEQCVEQMFLDIWQRCRPRRLTVAARYLRRGGLDINPWRSSDPGRAENPRWFLQ